MPKLKKKLLHAKKPEEQLKPRVLPTKSATAKVKTELSSSDSEDSETSMSNKAAATAVLVQNKKKATSVASTKNVSSRRDTVDSSSDSSEASEDDSDSDQHSKPNNLVNLEKKVPKKKQGTNIGLSTTTNTPPIA